MLSSAVRQDYRGTAIAVTIRGTSKTLTDSIDKLRKKVTPTEADGLYAGNRQKARILQRTQDGRDVDGIAFVQYSTNGPYIWYPSGRAVSKVKDSRNLLSARKREAKRLAKKIGLDASRVTSAGGVIFESYADFKQTLGRNGVDLRGPSAPHMLQAIVVKTTGSKNKLTEVLLGVYGEFAERGRGHNEGVPEINLPKRRWFGASKQDAEQFSKDIIASIRTRLGE